MRYLASLGLTLLIEVPVYAVALRFLFDVALVRGAVAGAAVNLVSHPLGFLAIQPSLLGPLGYRASLAIVEVFALLLEPAMLFAWQRRDPLILLGISVVTNGLSLAVGLLVLIR